MKLIIATIRPWNIENAERFEQEHPAFDVDLITDPDDLTAERVRDHDPRYVFFPHWSWKIPDDVIDSSECVLFHMTDLPYGRGGSPLQNLIVRGNDNTKITAFRGSRELDAGPVYMKEPLSLEGTAQEIYERASDRIFFHMIPHLIEHEPEPEPQEGEVVEFERRTPEDGALQPDFDLDQIYDYIRMLDAEGYPEAFLDFGNVRLRFSNAEKEDDRIVATVEFMERSS
jgi:methionyl-tRNA formyltransferase